MKEKRQEGLFIGIGTLLSFLIHGVVVAGLLFALVSPEQVDNGLPVLLLLNNDGAPSEQPKHLSVTKAGLHKLRQRVGRANPPNPLPQAENSPTDEKPIVAPSPVTTEVDATAPAVPSDVAFRTMADPDAGTFGVKGKGRENGKAAGEGQGRGSGTGGEGTRTSPGSEVAQEGMARGYLDGHFTYLRELIFKRLKYPPDARKSGYMGRVTVSFVILENGSVSDLGVISSSGHRVLDENVLQTIRGLGALPKPPVKVQIVLPISYSLD